MHPRNLLSQLALALAAFLTLATPAAARVADATTITLRSGAEIALAPDAKSGLVRLADVADVTGPDSQRYREAVVVSDARAAALDFVKGFAVGLDDVKAALENLPGGVHWGRVELNGSTCLVRGGGTAKTNSSDGPDERAASSRARATPLQDAVSRAASDTEATTLRGVIAARIAALYGVGLDHLRFKIAAPTRADEAALDATLRLGERAVVQPSAGGNSARLPLRVDIYDGASLVDSRSYAAEIQILRAVVIASERLERDQPISADSVHTEDRWIIAAGDSGARLEQVIGASPKRQLDAGRLIASGDLQSALVVERGETVWVHCISGGFVVKSKARALSAARDGQMVQLQADGTKKTLLARMSGRGVAVIELSGAGDGDTGDRGEIAVFRGPGEDDADTRPLPGAASRYSKQAPPTRSRAPGAPVSGSVRARSNAGPTIKR
ncbi:hypothetical protein BH11PLA1_BH11PLA1_17200 [soil metagenome]